MGPVTSLRKAGAAGQRAARPRPDQPETSKPASDPSAMEGPISLAAALGSIMLSLDADRSRTHQSGR